MTPATTPTIIPAPDVKGWTQATSWIQFFKLLQEGKQVWVRVATRLSDSSDPEELDLCGTEENGFFLEREPEPESGWLHHFGKKEWSELREVLGERRTYLDSLAEELGLGLK